MTLTTKRGGAGALALAGVLLAVGCDDGGSSNDADTGDGAAVCDSIGTAENVGEACTGGIDSETCGAGGSCLDFGSGAQCYQTCVPGVCTSLCTVPDEVCLSVTGPTGDPVELEPGVPLGVCGLPPTGTQGIYDPCGTPETGACQAGLDCLMLSTAEGTLPICAPRCTTSTECPELSGVSGVCRLTMGSATEPTNCALSCDPAATDGCPAGMGCHDLGGSFGVCLWPEG